MSDSDERDSDTEARILSEDANSVESYVKRGRRYAYFSVEDLSSAFVGAYKRLADEIDDPFAIRATSDVGAEYSLRGFEPPFYLIVGEVEILAQTISKRFNEATDEELEQVNELVARSLTRMG